MLYEIITHTPRWVWAIFAGLLWLGLSQVAPRRVRLRRIIVLPLVLTGFSLYGALSSFEPQIWNWLLWIGAGLVSAAWFASADLPHGAAYDHRAQVFNLPGSWMPLVLMMAIFLTRYAVGAALAMHPAWHTDTSVAALVASLYGALSGIFLGRMLRLLRLARQSNPAPLDAPTVAWG